MSVRLTQTYHIPKTNIYMASLKAKPRQASTPRSTKRIPQTHVHVIEFMQQQITLLHKANRMGTAQNYEKTLKSFTRFLSGSNPLLSDVTEQLITEYNTFLAKQGLSRNSTSFYMRVMRALYNKAVRQKLVVQSYPFTDVYTGIDHTRKRAIPESELSHIYKANLPKGSPLSFARDVFMFSYFTRGMAFVDISYLKKGNILDGVITYTRRKTGQGLSIKIEPCIQEIIDRYSDTQSPYVFPILNAIGEEQSYKEYQAAINNHNRQLNLLSKLLSINCKLTSYTPRHSWATAARNHNIPISVISAGMGHSSEQTTRIYLDSLENSIIDNANMTIISSVTE